MDTVVSLIKAAYHALLSALTPTRSYVPDDLPLRIMEVCQTSSHPEFNKVFADEVSEARRHADKYGGVPNWNTITQTLSQASSTYRRLKLSGEWDTPSKRSPAFSVHEETSPSRRTEGTSSPRQPPTCWNCGETGHTAPTCPKPCDPDAFKKNKQAFLDARCVQRSRQWPRTKTAKDGSKLVLNAKGYYVHATSKASSSSAGTKKKKSSKVDASKLADTIKSTFGSFIAKLEASPPVKLESPPPAASSSSSAPSTAPPTLAAHIASLRDALIAEL